MTDLEDKVVDRDGAGATTGGELGAVAELWREHYAFGLGNRGGGSILAQ